MTVDRAYQIRAPGMSSYGDGEFARGDPSPSMHGAVIGDVSQRFKLAVTSKLLSSRETGSPTSQTPQVVRNPEWSGCIRIPGRPALTLVDVHRIPPYVRASTFSHVFNSRQRQSVRPPVPLSTPFASWVPYPPCDSGIPLRI